MIKLLELIFDYWNGPFRSFMSPFCDWNWLNSFDLLLHCSSWIIYSICYLEHRVNEEQLTDSCGNIFADDELASVAETTDRLPSGLPV